MTKLGPITGIVGFFDILGYQSFLVNNEPETAAYEVLNTLTGIPKQIPKFVIREDPGFQKHHDIMDTMQWLVFSDTILVTSAALEGENIAKASIRWVFFLCTCAVLQRHMFEFGLPLRGAITTGNFMMKGNCFAGRPIIDAYRLTQDIDLAATILSADAYNELIQTAKNWGGERGLALREFVQEFLLEYLVPMKTQTGKRCFTLNFFAYKSPSGRKPEKDVVQMVFEAFWRHNKDIPCDAVRKARNTEQYLRFLMYKHPENFIKSRKGK